jgi:tetratricopeptide (TPR) repeat protein
MISGGIVKKHAAILVTILIGTFSLPAQDYGTGDFDYDWEGLEYDWDTVIEEPPDFVDPYAPPPDPVPVPTPAPTPVPAQTPAPAPSAVPALAEPEYPAEDETPEPAPLQGKNYTVFFDGDEADAQVLLEEMELRMDLYNRLFHFDPAAITGTLQVRSISDGERYENYVQARLDEAPPGAVYIHYSREDRRELVIHRGSAEEPAMVSHQAFIQYLRAFIPDPPSWIQDGFAIVFSALGFDAPAKELVYHENLTWLDTVKKTGGTAADPETILLADTEEYSGEAIEHFKPLSWSLASFFLNSGSEDYFRTLTEMFMVLSPNATAAENSRAAVKRLTLWTDFETITADYRDYLASRKSFAELIETGQKAYTAGDRTNAELSFTEALSARPDQAVPYYYLGLIAYDDKNFARAEELYTAALECGAGNGADSALIQYALGLNAVSSGRNADGIRWLEQAASAAPDRYGEKTRALIERLR